MLPRNFRGSRLDCRGAGRGLIFTSPGRAEFRITRSPPPPQGVALRSVGVGAPEPRLRLQRGRCQPVLAVSGRRFRRSAR
eukprot:11972444-Alexandrium_andersonii.AAC.1